MPTPTDLKRFMPTNSESELDVCDLEGVPPFPANGGLNVWVYLRDTNDLGNTTHEVVCVGLSKKRLEELLSCVYFEGLLIDGVKIYYGPMNEKWLWRRKTQCGMWMVV